MADAPKLLTLRISVDYPGKPNALHDVAVDLQAGEVLGLIGHSGSGKSTLALAILRLLDFKSAAAHGEIWFDGQDLMKLRERDMLRLRGRDIGLVLQSPMSSLNPALRIGTLLRETWLAHSSDTAQWRERAAEALANVSLPTDDKFFRRYPSEVSVGQAQRVLIAMAILHRPKLVIADEPTSALDPITSSEILALFSDLNRRLGMALLYISHDLLSVSAICQRIAIMHDGQIVETGSPGAIFETPQHPYTQKLVQAMPHAPVKAAMTTR